MKTPNEHPLGELVAMLRYDGETGSLTWLATTGRAKVGQQVVCLSRNGYLRLQIAGRDYLAHRVAWALAHGRWPEGQIDHINGVRNDNRLSNLREVTHQQNCENKQRASKINGSSGMLGVYWAKERSTWVSFIKCAGKAKYLGSFPTPELAQLAYLRAKRLLHGGCTI